MQKHKERKKERKKKHKDLGANPVSERGVGQSVFRTGEKAPPPAGGERSERAEALPSASVEGASLKGFQRGGLIFLFLK